MSRPRKYRKGSRIFTLEWLSKSLKDGEWIYYKGKPLHPSFIGHMNFYTVIGDLNAGNFSMAELNEERETK